MQDIYHYIQDNFAPELNLYLNKYYHDKYMQTRPISDEMLNKLEIDNTSLYNRCLPQDFMKQITFLSNSEILYDYSLSAVRNPREKYIQDGNIFVADLSLFGMNMQWLSDKKIKILGLKMSPNKTQYIKYSVTLPYSYKELYTAWLNREYDTINWIER